MSKPPRLVYYSNIEQLEEILGLQPEQPPEYITVNGMEIPWGNFSFDYDEILRTVLDERSALVIDRYVRDGASLRKIGEEIGVSHVRVQQIRDVAYAKIAKELIRRKKEES